MDDHLQKLTRELRDETCPPTVLERVMQRIAREKSARRRSHFQIAWAMSSLCLLCAGVAWQWQARRDAETRELADKAEADRAIIVDQTRGALVYIGQTLLEAAAHSENTLLKEAVPPMRHGFEAAKNKITKQI